MCFFDFCRAHSTVHFWHFIIEQHFINRTRGKECKSLAAAAGSQDGVGREFQDHFVQPELMLLIIDEKDDPFPRGHRNSRCAEMEPMCLCSEPRPRGAEGCTGVVALYACLCNSQARKVQNSMRFCLQCGGTIMHRPMTQNGAMILFPPAHRLM